MYLLCSGVLLKIFLYYDFVSKKIPFPFGNAFRKCLCVLMFGELPEFWFQ